MSDPTPTAADIGQAQEIAWKWAQRPDEYGSPMWGEGGRKYYFEFEDIQQQVRDIARAIAAARLSGAEAQRERDCKAVCEWCKGGTFEDDGDEYTIQPATEEVGGWYHDLVGKTDDAEPVECCAAAIRVAGK